MARMSLVTSDALAAFTQGGGFIKKVETGANSGIRSKDWKRLVRGEAPEIEEPIAPSPRAMTLRAGYGEVR